MKYYRYRETKESNPQLKIEYVNTDPLPYPQLVPKGCAIIRVSNDNVAIKMFDKNRRYKNEHDGKDE